jgi:pimeloyl-ACP methyl ester carboxylesterase
VVTTEQYARTRDGTRIAYERLGDGEPVILVAGALMGREAYRPLAVALSRQFTVFNYDRRGRGGSGDTVPYTVEREVEDLGALIAAAGGTASVYGHSSGAALALHAAARGLPIDKLVLHEPPFRSGSDDERRTEEAAERMSVLLSQHRLAEAIKAHLSPVGLPPELVEHMSQDPALQANAPTLCYDPFEVMSDRSRGGKTPAEQASGVTVRALVLAGGTSPEWMVTASRQIAEALPNGQILILDGQEHVVPPEILTPILTRFMTN